MVDVIKCAVCGENNSADQEFCQSCQSRLTPLTGPLKGADAPLQPGQIPTKKVTAELEPILPQWLREARDKARLSAEDDPSQGLQQYEQVSSTAGPSEPDLLAGLRSQSRSGDDDEETPDWLANITGVSPKSKKVDSSSVEGRRVELGDIGDFARDTAPLQESTPSWLSSVQAASQENERDELKDWFRESSGLTEKKQTSADDSSSWMAQAPQTPSPSAPDDAPDWLRQMSDPAATDDSPPAWLDPEVQKDAQAAESSPFGSSPFGAFETDSPSTNDAPGWLQGGDSTAASSDASSSETDWLKAFDTPKPDQPLKKNTTPLWLRGTENPNAPPAPEAETPVWLEDDSSASSLPPPGSTPALTSDDQIGFGEIPGWLKAAAPQSSIFDSPAADTPPASTPEPGGWASTFSDPPASAAFSFDQPKESPAPAAFTPDAFQDGSADSLFTEMPDWLSTASAPAPGASSSASASDPLTPGDLPSWVQAMRPVDTGFSKPSAASSDQTLETRGALSGLQGVLPAVPGFAPSSKPKIHSIKLQATREQQAHAALLEQILAAEAEPVPITSFSPLRPSRSLRWFLSVLVLGLLGPLLFLQPQIFAMPSVPPAVPGQINPIDGAMAATLSVPPDALVLVAIDYHPARAAEMQALASPIFDQMMILQHPHLVFVSTNETGPLLAEQFMSGPMGERAYQYGSQYLNLGYLPGGVMGIRSFIQDPRRAAPFDIYLTSAWEGTPMLQGVGSLSQFAAMIVITDDAESARAWVEQTTPLRTVTPFPLVLISSSQVGPMLMPYHAAGQVNGLVSGLYDGAIAEQKSRLGTIRLYWDAFSMGTLLAVSVMLLGGLWNAALGLRDRSAKAGRA